MTAARLWAAAFLIICGLTFDARAEDAATLKIGVRTDAPPFSYQSTSGEYKGYLVDICRRAAIKMGAEVAYVKVTALNRFKKVEDKQVDILCDPTTVTILRLKKYDFSPILFISGSSYLSSRAADDALRVQSWKIHDERIEAGEAILNRFGASMIDGEFPEPDPGAVADLPACDAVEEDRILGARIGMLAGTTARKAIEIASTRNIIRMNKHDTACIRSDFATHTEAVEAMCDGDISYYFGDRDILVSVLAKVLGERTDDCDARIAREFFTIEPYGLILSDGDPKRRRELVAAIMAVHREQRGNADGDVELVPQQLFREHFPDKRASDLLQNLFIILNVPE